MSRDGSDSDEMPELRTVGNTDSSTDDDMPALRSGSESESDSDEMPALRSGSESESDSDEMLFPVRSGSESDFDSDDNVITGPRAAAFRQQQADRERIRTLERQQREQA